MTVEATTETPKISPQMEAFNTKVGRLIAASTEADRATVAALVKADQPIGVKEITPPMAAVLFKNHNGHNRDFGYAKALYYAMAMERGEWKLTHQGVAFYPDGNTADGQHRFGGIVLSDKAQRFVVMTSFADDAYDAIDSGKGRTSGDAGALAGIADAGIKSSVSREVMRYEEWWRSGRRYAPTIIETVKFMSANDRQLKTVTDMARTMVKNCSEPCMSEAETASAALLMVRGGYAEGTVSGYLSAIQLGVADHDGAAALDLSRQFMKAKHSEKAANRMGKSHKLALICKGAPLHVLGKSVRSVRWDPKKEPVPAPTPPVVSEAAE